MILKAKKYFWLKVKTKEHNQFVYSRPCRKRKLSEKRKRFRADIDKRQFFVRVLPEQGNEERFKSLGRRDEARHATVIEVLLGKWRL